MCAHPLPHRLAETNDLTLPRVPNVSSSPCARACPLSVPPQGTLKWKYPTAGALYWTVPAVGSDGTVYFGSYLPDNRTYAVNADGTLKWTFLTGNGISSSPTVDGDVVYIGSSDGYLYALQGVNGVLKWKAAAGGSYRTSPAVVENTVYVTGAYDGSLYALNKTDGTVQWKYVGGAPGYGSPSIAGDVVYFGSNNYVYAVSR